MSGFNATAMPRGQGDAEGDDAAPESCKAENDMPRPRGIKPYYDDGAGIVIYHGRCEDVLPGLATDSADLVLTDPPYGVGKAEWDTEFPLWWLEDAARIAPVLGLMTGPNKMLMCPRSIGRLQFRWCLAAHLVNGMTLGTIGFANWIPCLVYSADGALAYTAAVDCKDFAIGRERKPDHPSPKPYGVMRWLISRLPGQRILDPFMGSGTTLRAAKDLGRTCIGIERDERYCRIAVERLRQGVLPLDLAAGG